MSNFAYTTAPQSASSVADGAPTSTILYRVGDPAPPPLKPFTETELIDMWGGKTGPVVSILCPTYNHRSFIADALDGFLGQATAFPFEIIVRDDASADGTTDIVRDYAQRYPNVIRPIVEVRNTFQIGIGARGVMASASRGRLIALCDGDDYWTDRDKLALQVQRMDQDSRIALSSTATAAVRDGVIVDLIKYNPDRAHSFRRFGMTHVSSWLLRSDLLDLTSEVSRQILCGDLLIKSQADVAGETVHLDNRVTAVYRHHDGSMWSGTSGRAANYKTLQTINSWLWIAQYHRRAGNSSMARRQMRYAAGRWLDHLRGIGPGEALMFWSAFTAIGLKRLLLPKRRGS